MGRRCEWPIVVVLMLVAVVGCGGGTPPSGTPVAGGPQALPAGTYESQAFQPPVAFTLPTGWWIASDAPDYLALQPIDSDQSGIFLFRDPYAASQDGDCPLIAEPNVGTSSAQLAGWIRGLRGLSVSNPRLVDVGGLRGTEIDVQIVSGWTASCPFANGLPAVPLFVDEATDLRWVVAGSERLRLSLIDVPGGGTVVVDIDAFDGALMDGLLSAATPIVASMAFSTP
jgi:hypothetical protein